MAEPTKVSWDESSSDVTRDIQHGAIRCGSCSARYDVIWGAPFLGAFDDRDIIGLIEIAANARADNGYADAATIRRLERLVVDYHGADDRTAFVRDQPDDMVRAPWFLNRYNEWLHFTTITAGISFEGRRVLDVGAGTGVDSYRLVAAGAEVTAIEYNPMLIHRGLGAVPEVRWVGGLSHALPFVAGSFDIVCCNAALHHMRDLPTSLEEMLRVLRPGGWLITTGDAYRARHLGEDHELAVFNRHPAVLLGVNESIPSFADFESGLEKYSSKLAIKIVTDGLYPAQSGFPDSRFARITDAAQAIGRVGARILSRGGTRENRAPKMANGLQWWDFDRDRLRLGNCSGSIALRCQVRQEITIPPRCQGETVISAGEYAESLIDYQQAIQKLAPHVPAQHIDSPFPGDAQTKFALLNGWLAPDGGQARIAYRRARWFLRRPVQANELTISVRYLTEAVTEPVSVNVLINGVKTLTVPVTSDWLDATVPVRLIPPGDICVVELQLSLEPATFDDGLFEVRKLEFCRE
jgi:ubiquinone/menaquinone biosynthesis C-methylase UbiE